MNEAPIPLDDKARLAALFSLQILDTDPEERFDRITRIAKHTFGVETSLISLVDLDRQWFKSRQGLDACETGRDISFCGHAILGNRLFIVEDASEDSRFADNPLVVGEPHIRFYAGAPIRVPSGYKIGTLCLIDPKPRKLSIPEQNILRDLAAMLENELSLMSQSAVDGLTQVANRRGFSNVISHYLPLCERTGMPAEVALFDLDGFKQVNDTHGHEAGNSMLRHFAMLLSASFRSADVVARIGGDEFAVFLVDSESGSTAALRRLEELAIAESNSIEGTLAWSVGCIAFDPDRHSSVDELLADADARMYADKNRRRVARG